MIYNSKKRSISKKKSNRYRKKGYSNLRAKQRSEENIKNSRGGVRLG